jgi:hypothetical protein
MFRTAAAGYPERMAKTRTAKPKATKKSAARKAEPVTPEQEYERKVAERRQAVLERRGLR